MDLRQLGRRAKEQRKRQQLTLEELAERVGISRNFLWEIEAGRKAPALPTLYHLSVALNISLDYLMGTSDDMRSLTEPGAQSETDLLRTRVAHQLQGFDTRELTLISGFLREFEGYVENK